ncbi:MAG: right-handed parallel beta-helix repeat-containing protein [Fimbriimonadaceae bacterium]|nr:right-handed parallel beta-helix repeat-containing protein [Fimbriimonadaceae bacterium]
MTRCLVDGPGVNAGYAVGWRGSLALYKTQAEAQGSGLSVVAGGRLRAWQCRLAGRGHGAWVWSGGEQPSRAELDGCELTGTEYAALLVQEGSSAKPAGCRLTKSQGNGVQVDGAPSQVEIDRCTLTGNGAFELKSGGQVRHTGCTVDPGDATVPG